MADDTLTLHEVAEILDVHYMTVYRYVRLGMLPATKRGSIWQVRRSDLTAFRKAESKRSRSGSRSGGAPVDWTGRLRTRLLAGDELGAWGVVEAALASGKDPSAAYLDVLAPALRAVGTLWESGDVTVAQEHRATVIAGRIIGRLSPRFAHRGRSKGTVVIGGAPGDLHALATSMIADLLRGAGFDVVDLGANVPEESFVGVVESADRLRAVGISAFTAGNDDAVRRLVAAIKRVSTVPILVGGRAVPNAEHAVHLGADAWATDGLGVVRFVEALVAVPK